MCFHVWRPRFFCTMGPIVRTQSTYFPDNPKPIVGRHSTRRKFFFKLTRTKSLSELPFLIKICRCCIQLIPMNNLSHSSQWILNNTSSHWRSLGRHSFQQIKIKTVLLFVQDLQLTLLSNYSEFDKIMLIWLAWVSNVAPGPFIFNLLGHIFYIILWISFFERTK